MKVTFSAGVAALSALALVTILSFALRDNASSRLRTSSTLPDGLWGVSQTDETAKGLLAPAKTITDPTSLNSLAEFDKRSRYFASLKEGDPEIVKIRTFVKDHFFQNRNALIEWLGAVPNENKLFLNAFREFGSLALKNGLDEEYHKLFEKVTELQAVALFDGAVSVLVEQDPISAFEYREEFRYPLNDSRAQYDSYLIGKAVSSGKGDEALKAIQRFVYGKGKMNAISEVFYSWADYDPVSAIPHLEAISDPQVKELSEKKFYTRWANRDLKGLEEWLSSQPPSSRLAVSSALSGTPNAGP